MRDYSTCKNKDCQNKHNGKLAEEDYYPNRYECAVCFNVKNGSGQGKRQYKERNYSTCANKKCGNPKNGNLTQDDYHSNGRKLQGGELVLTYHNRCRECRSKESKDRREGKISKNDPTQPSKDRMIFGSMTPPEIKRSTFDVLKANEWLKGAA